MSILNYWAQEFEDKLADLIYTQFSKVNGGTPNKKRQRYVVSVRSLSFAKILFSVIFSNVQ